MSQIVLIGAVQDKMKARSYNNEVKTTEREVIIRTALFSRLILILLQYVSNILIPDHKADAFCSPKLEDEGPLNKLVNHFLGGFVRWDAHHFLHISKYGYTYEHSLAFFPFYPILVRYVAILFHSFTPFFSIDSLLIIVFLSINVLCFILSALCLYELSSIILSKSLAYKATLLFCYNPASVFFTAPYSESIYSYLTFKSMLNSVQLYKKYCNFSNLQFRDVVYIIPISLSTLTRSNGVLNIGFLIYALICLYFENVKLKKQIFNQLLYSIKFILVVVILVSSCLIPFVAFQIFSFNMFCKDFETSLPALIVEQAQNENFVLPGTFSKHNQSWCFRKIPLAYSYVQSYYWKVGFLQYYEFKQIPNFILAFPIVFIIISGTLGFFKQFPKRFNALFNFNLISQKRVERSNPVMVVFVIHGIVLTIFCVFSIHIQVTTRMLCSASPVLYWFSVYYISDSSRDICWRRVLQRQCCIKERIILSYYLGYFLMGTMMFCNFLPWT